MPRWTGTTTQRGLGHAHQADKKRLLAALRPGDPCLQRFLDGTICGQPMFPWQELDRGHVTDRALGGANGPAILVHAGCNRKAGAQLGNAMQAAGLIPRGLPQRIKPCSVCGKITDRPARSCEICGAHCHPSHSFVRTCGRKCGVILSRRNKMAKGWIPPAQRPEPYASRAAIAYYTCRYCGELQVAHATGAQRREVCPARICQLARLRANNLRLRDGLSREDADAEMAVLVKAAMAATPAGQVAWSALAWTHALEGDRRQRVVTGAPDGAARG